MFEITRYRCRPLGLYSTTNACKIGVAVLGREELDASLRKVEVCDEGGL